MLNKGKTVSTLLLVLLAGCSAAWAGTLHIGPGAGTPCAQGCAGDPNQIGTTVLDIFQTSGGSKLVSPELLIVGVPNDPTNLFLTDPISGVTYYNPYPGGSAVAGTSAFATAGTYGLKAAVSGGFFGDMTSKSEVYSFLGLAGPTNNSNSFTNWTAADLAINGINAKDFGIYVFVLSGANLGPKGLINLSFAQALPTGSYVVSYGKNSKGTPSDTAFTEAGLTTRPTSPTPEPASLVLLGSGLLALNALRRRRLGSLFGR